MQQKLVLNGPYANRDFFNFVTTSQLPRHRWYNFKEGFSVGLINEAIKVFPRKKNLNILDPFNGCGTTVLTASLQKHSALGIEVNPFLEFVTRVKTAPNKWESSDFEKTVNKVVVRSRGGAYSDLEKVSTFTPKKGLDKWLFNTSVIRRYTGLINEIQKLDDSELKRALKFSALVSIMECCNARKDGKGLRYRRDWENLRFSSKIFENEFVLRSGQINADVSKSMMLRKHQPKVILSDSRKLLSSSSFHMENIDLVITSPPYLNSFDYSDVYRPELFLGEFVANNIGLTELRKKTLRSHVQTDWDRTIEYESDFIASYVHRITSSKERLWNNRIPLMVKAYFDDISVVLKNMRPRIKKNGQIWMVVSTSAYAGVHIPVDLIIGEVGSELGYKLKGIHCLRNMRTASQQYEQLKTKKIPLRESLIILQR